MGRPGPKRKPSFFWQGLLIVLPVLVLAVVGVLSLRQDRLLARHEAAERAQGVVDDLIPKIRAELAPSPEPPSLAEPVFQVDDAGQLLFPPSYAPLPTPQPLDASQLNSEQARLWLAVQSGEAAGADSAAAVQAFRDFLATAPPARFAAAVQYGLGLRLLKDNQFQAAADLFRAVLEKYPDASGESGLPLGPFASLRLIEIQGRASAPPVPLAGVEAFCSNAVFHPTLLTPDLLALVAQTSRSRQDQEAVSDWQRRWAGHELSRRLFAAASPRLRAPAEAPRMFWLEEEIEGRSWLAVRSAGNPGGLWFTCRSETQIQSSLDTLLHTAKHLPDYLRIDVELAGKRFIFDAPQLQLGRAAGIAGQPSKARVRSQPSTLLATSADAETGPELLKVSAYLGNPALLFQRQRARSRWFGLLIAAAAAAAIIGLAAAYRAFHRQLRLSEMKSNFVSSVSHELRAPIASVRLMAESLDRGKIPDPAKQREYFRFIVQECGRLSSLIANVLDFSRIEQGRKQYEFEPTDVAALARQTVKLMETYAAERHVGLALTIPEAQVPALSSQPVVDGKALQQALVNLVDNAIKHSPKGGTVTIGLEAEGNGAAVSGDDPPRDQTGAARRLRLWVEDHGPGIPVEEHEKIFERFYRCGSELRRETQGVGIGLSIVKHVVEAHHGRVEVRSAVGQGSRFTIELPLPGPQGANEERPSS